MISRRLSALIVVFLMHLSVSSAFANFAARNIYAPVGNTTVTGTDVQFTWEGGPAGAGWWLQVSDNPSFTPPSSIILNTATNVYYYDARCIGPYSIGGSYYCSTISTTYAISPNNTAHSKQLYWHVAGTMDGYFTNDNWSPVGGFLQAPSPPATPVLNSPINDSKIEGTSVTFKWSSASNVTNYYLEVYNKNNALIYGSWVGNVSSFTPAVTFANDGGRCSWQVKAKNDGGESSFTAKGYFVNGNPPVTTAPGSLSPAHRTFVSPNLIFSDNVIFQWSSVANATSYQLVMYETNDPLNTQRSISTNATNYDTSSDSSIVLKRGTKYSWNVRGVNASGLGGPVSTTISFIVGSAECWPEVGTGQTHIDTCYDLNSNPGIYRLKDISRRAEMNVDGHKGDMEAPNAIITMAGSAAAGALTNSNNSWTAGGAQKKAIDAQVNSAKVYDYFLDPLLNPADTTTARWFERNSFDGAGGSMLNIVENPTANCGGACYNPADNTVNFDPGSTDSGALDVVTHEWAHGITATTSRLVYEKESGALDEAFSDWMAIAHKQARGSTSWEVIQGGNTVLRNVANPTLSFPAQPVIYKKNSTWTNLYNNTPDWGETDSCSPTGGVNGNDYCWVHYNSGVPNKMFYLLANSGSNYEVSVQGIGIARAMQIAYIANTDKWKSNTFSLSSAKDGMVSAAEDLLATPNEISQIKLAWTAVGVGDLPKITTSASSSLAGTTVAYLENEQLPVCTPANDACIDHRYKSNCCSNDTYYSAWDKRVTVEATPKPNAGYYFQNWTEDGEVVSSSPAYTFTVTGDRTLVANFTTTPPAMSSSSTSGDFNSVATGTTSLEHTFTVINSGPQSISIYPVTFGGANPTEFTITSNGCSGSLLSPTASCQIKVSFAPSSTAGIRTASLIIPSSAPDSPSHVIALSGFSGLPAMAKPAGSYDFSYYSSIQSAYNNVGNGNGIRLWATDFNENLDCNRPVTVTLRGGYNGIFAERVGKTALQGAMTISSGTVIIDSLQIGGSSYRSALSVVVDSLGSGTITSSPAAINCSNSCTASFINGEQVTLTASPVGDAVFTGWSGAGCSGTGSCTLTMTDDIAVTASFNAAKISVVPSSESLGSTFVGTTTPSQAITVTSSGTQVLTVGAPSFSGSNPTEFTITEDFCSGRTLAPSATCTVVVSFAPASAGAKSASLLIPSNDPQTPAFNILLNGIGTLPSLIVTKSGIGVGTVTSSPEGISCGNTCSATFMTNSAITLSAVPDTGYTFVGWTGACSGTGNCVLPINADITVNASFEKIPIASCSANPAKIDNTFYPSIQAAYNAALDGAVIKLLSLDFTENLSFGQNKYVTLDGGYLCGFASNPETTIIHGDPHIVSGMVKMKNVRVVQ